MAAQKDGSVQSVYRSFALAEILHGHPQGLPIKEICALAGLPKSTTHRLLSTLVELGYAAQSGAGLYRATFKMFGIGSQLVGRLDLVSVAKPHVAALSAQTGKTVHLVVPEGAEVVYVYKCDGAGLQLSSRVGMRAPMYCTGVGKAILSTLPYEAAEALWRQSKVQKLAPGTITSWPGLEAQLRRDRRRGWSLDDEENEAGICCVAVSLPDPASGGVAAFSVSGLKAAMGSGQVEALAEACLGTRQRILQDLGMQATAQPACKQPV